MLRTILSYLLVGLALICNAQTNLNTQNNSVKPLYEFVQNQGQWHPQAIYKSSIPFGSLYLASDGITYDLVHPEDYIALQEHRHDHKTLPYAGQIRKHAIKMQFIGMQYAPVVRGKDIQKHYYNYYLGNKADKWAQKIHPAGTVIYENVYPGVDFEISGYKDIKYQWIVKDPISTDIENIKTKIFGANSISLENGKLIIQTSAGDIIDDEPYVYQEIEGQKRPVSARYKLVGDEFGYEILSEINPSYPLIIDPKLIFSTYSGSVGDNFGFTATYDSRGNLYSGGIVNNDGPYPVTAGAYDVTWNGGGNFTPPANLASDIAISKYDSAGNQLLWATFLGGNLDEYPHSLVSDNDDNLVILGTAYSENYPVSDNGYDTSHGGSTDIIVTKISADGTSLLGSTFLGGPLRDGLTLNNERQYRTGDLKYNYADDYRGDIITDDVGNIYVATMVRSKNMPTKLATQTTSAGDLDGYAFELNPDCSDLLWGTYIGGIKQDAFYSIVLEQSSKRIILGGGTASDNIQTKGDVFSEDLHGDIDGLLAIFDSTKTLEALTYWGTPKYDQIYFVDTDVDGRIYATGQTEGNLLKTAGAFGDAGKGQFVFRIDTLLKTVDLQTTFGNTIGRPNLAPSAFLVDVCGHIYFSGWGATVAAAFHPGSTENLPLSFDAIQKTTDNNDFYVIVFDKNASGLLYATYYGGNLTGDHVDGGTSRFDKKGVIYQSVCSSCPPSTDGQQSQVSDFPTTPGAVYETNPSVRCSNASFKIDLQLKTAVLAEFIADPIQGCTPLTVNFTNNSILGDTFYWDLGDGTTSTILNPTHTYETPGTYTVSLTVIDSNTCNVSSTYEQTITVEEQSKADFSILLEGCENELTLENLSENGFTYRWDFGNGESSSAKTPDYEYSEGGEYTITLHVNEGTLCESEYSEQINVNGKITPSITLYNVFTPNGDGQNDCFQFDGTLIECGEYKWKVYNRWGEEMFSANDPFACWNGKVGNEGKLVPAGTYFYILWYGTKDSNPISGQIEVIY